MGIVSPRRIAGIVYQRVKDYKRERNTLQAIEKKFEEYAHKKDILEVDKSILVVIEVFQKELDILDQVELGVLYLGLKGIDYVGLVESAVRKVRSTNPEISRHEQMLKNIVSHYRSEMNNLRMKHRRIAENDSDLRDVVISPDFFTYMDAKRKSRHDRHDIKELKSLAKEIVSLSGRSQTSSRDKELIAHLSNFEQLLKAHCVSVINEDKDMLAFAFEDRNFLNKLVAHINKLQSEGFPPLLVEFYLGLLFKAKKSQEQRAEHIRQLEEKQSSTASSVS